MSNIISWINFQLITSPRLRMIYTLLGLLELGLGFNNQFLPLMLTSFIKNFQFSFVRKGINYCLKSDIYS